MKLHFLFLTLCACTLSALAAPCQLSILANVKNETCKKNIVSYAWNSIAHENKTLTLAEPTIRHNPLLANANLYAIHVTLHSCNLLTCAFNESLKATLSYQVTKNGSQLCKKEGVEINLLETLLRYHMVPFQDGNDTLSLSLQTVYTNKD